MTLDLISFRNKKVGFWHAPVVNHTRTDEDLIESYRRALASGDFKGHPEELELYHLASFDDKTGEMNVCPKPVFIVSLDQLMPKGKISN